MSQDNQQEDSRYPYTYSADFIRSLVGYKDGSTILNRVRASTLRQGIADALGMDDEELAIRLADRERAKTEDEKNADVQAAIRSMENPSPALVDLIRKTRSVQYAGDVTVTQEEMASLEEVRLAICTMMDAISGNGVHTTNYGEFAELTQKLHKIIYRRRTDE